MMTNGEPKGHFFLSHPHTNNRLFSLLTIEFLFSYLKKGFQKFLNTLRCDTTQLHHFYTTMMPLVFQRATDQFLYLPWVGMDYVGKNFFIWVETVETPI